MRSAGHLFGFRSDPNRREQLRRFVGSIGYDTTDWLRVAMYRDCFARIAAMTPESLDVLEISGGPQWKRQFRFRSYEQTQYPEFDICAQRSDRTFDLVIADQVFEHLRSPQAACANVASMLRPGGLFIIAVPFLVRVHASPTDCSRWTEEGLRFLLLDNGFSDGSVVTRSWGNRACVVANFRGWRRMGWYKPMHNEPDFPVMIWAFAQKAIEKSSTRRDKIEDGAACRL